MNEESKYKNPFVGLRSFEEDEDYLFFGRKAEINDLLKKFSQSRFLSVIGSSGSGKSSLVKSGLLPALYSGFLSVGHNWRVAMIRPGNDPIGNLSKELAEQGVLYDTVTKEIPYDSIIESTLRRSSEGLSQVYTQARLPQTDNLLIVVDQFEELFRFSRYEKVSNQGISDSLNFINLLLNASKQSECPLYVLLTMRSDFLGDCAQFRGLPEAINEGQYLVPRMTRDEVKEAITGPIAVGGAQITQSLLTRLLNDVGNDFDQLPVLQHAMMRTWDAWVKRNELDTPINIDDYLKIGGMTESLSQHANEAFNELKTEDQKRQCELMFKALTDKAADVRGTRRPRSVSDLSLIAQSTNEEIKEIIEVFRRPGRTFLMPPPHIELTASSIIDISHESLMRVWDKLKSWTTEEVNDAELFKRIADAAKRESNGLASLWSDPELTQGLKWREKFNNNDELITVWAKTFDVDTALALSFLERSNLQALKIRQDAEAEEKARIKAEKFRRNSLRLYATIGLLSILTASAFTISFKYKKLSELATKNFNQAKVYLAAAERNADIANKNVIAYRKQKDTADYYAKIAYARLDTVTVQKRLAEEARIKAEEEEKIAKVAKETATMQRNQALVAKNRADSLSLVNEKTALKNAAATFKDLIRNFSTEEANLKDRSYKLMSFAIFLDSLRNGWVIVDSIKKTIQRMEPIKDANLIHHELYDKLYFCLKSFQNKDAERKPLRKIISRNDDTLYLRKSCPVYIDSSTNKKLICGQKNKRQVLFTSKSGIRTFTTVQEAKIIIYSTMDNNLFVSPYEFIGDSVVLKKDKEQKISMGGLVTSLGYYPSKGIIYFGLEKGELGFIKYQEDKNNQPIYRNNLGDVVTAVEFFVDSDGSAYLFAACKRGKAIVFELGKVSANMSDLLAKLKPDIKLDGIELPEYIGLISKARFDKDARKLILTSAKEKWSWNPFTRELLNELKSNLDKNKLNKRLQRKDIIENPDGD